VIFYTQHPNTEHHVPKVISVCASILHLCRGPPPPGLMSYSLSEHLSNAMQEGAEKDLQLILQKGLKWEWPKTHSVGTFVPTSSHWATELHVEALLTMRHSFKRKFERTLWTFLPRAQLYLISLFLVKNSIWKKGRASRASLNCTSVPFILSVEFGSVRSEGSQCDYEGTGPISGKVSASELLVGLTRARMTKFDIFVIHSQKLS
jgi:hypothetical protein